MKRIMIVLALAAVPFLMAAPAAHAGFGVSFGVFYSSLGHHGEWITVDAGVYAWRPMNVAAGWRPYWNGRWMWTDDGWYWDSDEPWAWAAYHYGRWYYDDYYGWIWIPGYEWAPAWVEWRYGGSTIGWAPLGPYALFNVHYGVHYARRWITPYHYWSFVDCRYMTHREIHRYVYRSEENTRYIGRTRTGGSVRPHNGRVVSRGPEPGYIERRADIRIPRTTLVDVEDRDRLRDVRSDNGERIGVFRPRIEDTRGDVRADRPEGLRERERMPSLDTRGMDVRRREEARESGREIERLAPRRRDVDADRSGDRTTRWYEVAPREDRDVQRQDVNRDVPRDAERRSIERRREDRSADRAPEGWRSGSQAPERRVQPAPGVSRPERSTPERSVQRAPQPRSSERPSSNAGRSAGQGSRGSERSGGSRDRR